MDIKQTLIDEIIQQIETLNREYEKSNENKKVHLIELNPSNYAILKKEIGLVMSKPVKTLSKFLDCRIAIVKDMEEKFKII